MSSFYIERTYTDITVQTSESVTHFPTIWISQIALYLVDFFLIVFAYQIICQVGLQDNSIWTDTDRSKVSLSPRSYISLHE